MGHDSPGDTGSHFSSAPLAADGAVVSPHTVNCFTMGQRCLPSPLQSKDGICSLFLSLPWSASLCGEGRAICPHYSRLTLGLLEICAASKHSIGPSLHPVQALKNHLRLIRWSTIVDHIGTRFLGGGATYTRERLICEYMW